MSTLKKRWLVVVGALAVALIMGAMSAGPEYGQNTDTSSASSYDAQWQVAGHEDDHGGG